MFRWIIGLSLIMFSIVGAFIWYQKTEVKSLPVLVRNYVNYFIPLVPEKEITLKFTGDVILARSVNFLTVKSGDFSWAFKNIAPELLDSDLTIINMESPLIDNCPLTNEGFIFCGDKRHILGLSSAGIDIVGLANNHLGNYEISGVNQTIKNLDSVGILSSGVQGREIAYKQINNSKFAFLSFNSIYYEGSGIPLAEEKYILKLLKEAKENSNFVVVQIQWGNEYTKILTEYQKNMGKFLIDNGADLVIGNHPHWIQDYEIYKGKYILYALGNFIFDQEWSKETKEGVIAKFTLKNNQVSNLEFIPVEIKNYGQVYKSNKYEIIPKEIK